MAKRQQRTQKTGFIIAGVTALAAILLLVLIAALPKPAAAAESTTAPSGAVSQSEPGKEGDPTGKPGSTSGQPADTAPSSSTQGAPGSTAADNQQGTAQPQTSAADQQGGSTQTPVPGNAILISPDNYELCVATAYVRIRQNPGTQYTILGVLAEGGAILRDQDINGWSRVYYNGRTAYVCSDYLKKAY